VDHVHVRCRHQEEIGGDVLASAVVFLGLIVAAGECAGEVVER
jgi:hypothetical protein